MKRMIGLIIVIVLVTLATFGIASSQNADTLDSAALENAIAIGELLLELNESDHTSENSCPNPFYDPHALSNMKADLAAINEVQNAIDALSNTIKSAIEFNITWDAGGAVGPKVSEEQIMGWTHELDALRDSLVDLLHQVRDVSDIYSIKVTAAEKLPDGSLYFGEGWQVSINNNTGSTIDALNVRMKFENAYHEQIFSLATAYYDIQIADIVIADGSTYTNIETSQYLPFPTIGFDATKYLYLTVSKYHTTDGETVTIPENKYLWFVVTR